jgi:CBS domain-containing protein
VEPLIAIRPAPDGGAPRVADHRVMKIEAIMTREVLSVRPETSLKEVARLLSENHISGLPVCDADGVVIGVISEADILRKLEGIPADVGGRFAWFFRRLDGELDRVTASTAGEAMTAPALTGRPAQHVSDAARVMIEHRINRLPVVLGGQLVGIVTRADLVRVFHRSDAEIEQEIRDEVLRNTLWAAPESMQLSVVGGVVRLRGSVETHLDATLADRLVRQVPGVIDADIELQWRADEPERDSILELYPR